jgi:Glycosyltransferase family 87
MNAESLAATHQASRQFPSRSVSVGSDRLPFIAIGGLIATTLALALTASATGLILPASVRMALPQSLPEYLVGAFGRSHVNLGLAGLIIVLTLMCLSYAIVVRSAERLPLWAVIAPIAALNVLVVLAPPLLSTDVFSYVAYSRMGGIYHVSPYLHGPNVIASDPLYPYVAAKWITTPSVYGPLFTAFGYLLAPFDLAVNVLAYKLIAAASSLLVVVLVWRAAVLRGLHPVKAIALVGLNPVTILYGVGGGHNDLIMLALLMGAVYLLLRDREGASGGLIAVAAAVKLSGGLLLPFALANGSGARHGRPSRAGLLAGVAVASAVLAVLSLVLFGSSALQLVGTLESIQSHGGFHSISGWLLTTVGLQSWIGAAGLALDVSFVAFVLWLTVRVWRGRLDWITAAGWATVALLVTAGYLLPWYVAWLIPLAALSTDRRLRVAALALTAIGLTTL